MLAAVLAPGEALHAFDGLDIAGAEVHPARPGLGRVVAFLLVLLGLVELDPRRLHGEGDEAAIGAELRRGAPRRAVLAAVGDVAHDEFAIGLLRHERVGDPLPVATQLRVLDAAPGGVDVMRDRQPRGHGLRDGGGSRRDRRGGLRRRGRGQRRERQQRERQRRNRGQERPGHAALPAAVSVFTSQTCKAWISSMLTS
jgi:hypothetical protein